MSTQTPQTDALVKDISIERYGKPLVAALEICLELERDLSHYKALCEELREALGELLWIWDCDSVKGTFQFAAIHGCGPTPETERIVLGVIQARAALKKAEKDI
jgi:hypothetical protein